MQALTAFPFTSVLTYDSTGWPQLDRAVGAEVLRKCLSNYFSNGVFLTANAGCFKVTAPADGTATVKVAPGVGLINGATGYTDTETSLDLPANNTSLARIDTVVLRLNDNTDFRNVYLDIIQGAPATKPAAPVLTQSDSIWELGLANVYRNANSTTVSNSSITDTRADSARCGQVNAISSIDTADFMAQLDAYYNEFTAKCEDDYNTSREAFDTWFETIKGLLDEDAAGHLQNEIDDLKANAGGSRFTLRFTFEAGRSFTNCTYMLTVGGTTREGAFSKDNATINENGILTVGAATLEVTFTVGVNVKTETRTLEVPYFGDYEFNVTLSDSFSYSGWLASIGKDASGYASLSSVLADEPLVRELMTRHASADYLAAKCSVEKDINALANNRVAVKWIGLRDYTADKLMAIPAWKTAILASEHWQYILRDSVPAMTSETTPEGAVSVDPHNQAGGYADWHAFDKSTTTAWATYGSAKTGWIQYKFKNPIIVNKFLMQSKSGSPNNMPDSIKLFGVNGSTETELFSIANGVKDNNPHYYSVDNNTAYEAYKLKLNNNTDGLMVGVIDFFGRSSVKDTSEWEFGDSTITMIYDHGVEVIQLETYRSNNSDVITKGQDGISYQVVAKSTASKVFAYTTTDVSQYKKVIAKVDTNKTLITNSSAYGGLYVFEVSASVPTSSVLWQKSNFKELVSLDISTINGTKAINVGYIQGLSSEAAEATVSLIYLKK